MPNYIYNLSEDTRNIYRPWIQIDIRIGYGILVLPTWKEWGLAIPIREDTTNESFLRSKWLQDMVSGVLSHSKDKAKLYKEGKLYYYSIVEEIEKFFKCERLC